MPIEASGRGRTTRHAWLRLQWLLLFAATLAAAFALQDGALDASDRLVYDRLMPLIARAAPDDIVIVAIDDKSIAGLGRWPWKRALHAQLLNVLSNGAPRAVGLDLLLTEAESISTNNGTTGSGDQALAAALARNGRTILPILSIQTETGIAARLPIAHLAAAAAGLAHIQLQADADGRVRTVWQSQQLGRYRWKAFGQAVQQLASPDVEPQRNGLLRIPFFGPAGHFHQVSYIDVLHGAVPAAFFRDKIVLVGALAAGLGDVYAIPQGLGQPLMSGVEIHANIVGALQQGRRIEVPPSALSITFTALPALLMLIGFTFLAPRATLGLTIGLSLAVVATCVLSFQHGWWLAPSAALLLLWLVYPLWNWRRLESALRYLDEETRRLATSAPFPTPAAPGTRRWDFLERRIDAARAATRRMLDLHQFVSDNLDSLPDAHLVTSRDGQLMLANRQAHVLFASLGQVPARGQPLAALLDALDTPRDWASLLLAPQAGGVEIRDRQGRIFAVRGTPSHNGRGAPIGWIVSLVDLTDLRAAQAQRDQSLNFISHDMRAPQSAILATLALQRQGQVVLEQDALFARIEKAVRSTLSLADDFVLLARAQAGHVQHEENNLDALLADAADDLWALARERCAHIDISSDDHAHWVLGERQMLVRVLANLLSNAIKYGPPGGRITCRLELDRQRQQVLCRIDDQGPGLPGDAQAFSAFYRAGGSHQVGVGLGLNFVRTVVQLHGGTVLASNRDGGGARFELRLPVAP